MAPENERGRSPAKSCDPKPYPLDGDTGTSIPRDDAPHSNQPPPDQQAHARSPIGEPERAMQTPDPLDQIKPLSRRNAVGGTSRQASLDVAPAAKPMMQAIEGFLTFAPHTPEELHAKLSEGGRRVLLTSVRARVCGLHKAGRVTDSGERGLGESGRSKVIRWRLTDTAERAAFEARKAAGQDGAAE